LYSITNFLVYFWEHVTKAISIDVLILLRNYCISMSEEAEREEIKEETDELRDSEEDEYEDNDVVKEE
jgi:hypothetical protein